MHVVASRAHGHAAGHTLLDPHPAVTDALGLLDHHDRVRASRDRRPRHDPDRLARPEHAIGRGARRHLGHDRQLDWSRDDVGGAHGVPVDGAVGEGWHLLAGNHIGGQHQPVRLVEVDVDRLGGQAVADHKRLGILERRHARHGTRR